MAPRFLSILSKRFETYPGLARAARNTGWLFSERLVRLGIGFVVTVLLARYLGPAQFGVLNYAVAIIAIIGVFAALPNRAVVVRELVKNLDQSRENLAATIMLLTIAGILAFIAVGVAGWLLRSAEQGLGTVLILLGSVFLFKAFDVALFWLESQVRSRPAMIVKMAVFGFSSIAKCALIFVGAPLAAFAAVIAAETILASAIIFAFFVSRGPGLSPFRAPLRHIKQLSKDSFPLILASVGVVLYMKMDIVMLQHLSGSESAGVYAVATSMSEVWYFLPAIIVASVYPSLVRASERDRGEYRRGLQQLYDLMTLLSVAIALPVSLVAQPLVVLFFGEAYALSGTVLAIHIWASVFVFLGVASGRWLVTENLQSLALQRTCVGAAINFCLNWYLIPVHGVVGAAIATVVSQFVAGFAFDALQARTRETFKMKCYSFNPARVVKNLWSF